VLARRKAQAGGSFDPHFVDLEAIRCELGDLSGAAVERHASLNEISVSVIQVCGLTPAISSESANRAFFRLSERTDRALDDLAVEVDAAVIEEA